VCGQSGRPPSSRRQQYDSPLAIGRVKTPAVAGAGADQALLPRRSWRNLNDIRP
jgi:hypothetical protein